MTPIEQALYATFWAKNSFPDGEMRVLEARHLRDWLVEHFANVHYYHRTQYGPAGLIIDLNTGKQLSGSDELTVLAEAVLKVKESKP